MTELSGWREVAAGTYVCVAEPATVTLGLVVGSEGALIIDTGSTPAQGRALRASVTSVTSVPVVAAVATHWHFDHLHGLAAFADLVTIGHESLLERLETVRAAADAPPYAAELTAPNRAIAVAMALDLGGRRVEIAHLGGGHTDGDLVVVVADADVLFTGDLIESAGPPWFGDDSVPHEWPSTLDGVIGLMTARTIAIPGHGPEVDREFVFNARGEIAAVSGEIRHLVETGVSQVDAYAAGTWPFPLAHLEAGIARGYADLAGHGLKGTRPTLPLA